MSETVKPPNTPVVHGLLVTPLTQCTHWHSPLDIIAIKHFCCHKYYACITCHNACETHSPSVWPRTLRDEMAVLCGQCKHVLSIDEYMKSGSKCTECGSGFNPGCKNHWNLYFEVDENENVQAVCSRLTWS
ncbi:Helper of Tim 13 [Pyrenophora seminiperda CCB06]|uniref:Helper of Tim 13 n=1 Tax=Pyrenophora seminiperda CCB06 TaxID=1302712 RepID=A0A3M7MAK1_9PLEO|nr:Helper of Tim 13 [Pyrenophora seminiperda CCB06]